MIDVYNITPAVHGMIFAERIIEAIIQNETKRKIKKKQMEIIIFNEKGTYSREIVVQVEIRGIFILFFCSSQFSLKKHLLNNL